MLYYLQIVVFLMGLLSLFLSINYLVFFLTINKHVGRSMVFLMCEQIVSATGTLMFSMNSLWLALSGNPLTEWNIVNPTIAIVIRMTMFAAMIHANVHLTYTIRSVLAEVDSKKE